MTFSPHISAKANDAAVDLTSIVMPQAREVCALKEKFFAEAVGADRGMRASDGGTI